MDLLIFMEMDDLDTVGSVGFHPLWPFLLSVSGSRWFEDVVEGGDDDSEDEEDEDEEKEERDEEGDEDEDEDEQEEEEERDQSTAEHIKSHLQLNTNHPKINQQRQSMTKKTPRKPRPKDNSIKLWNFEENLQV